ncbi:MAG: lantibiotic dehydratase C-terminal domain-containing protein [Bacteroidota bacterium]
MRPDFAPRALTRSFWTSWYVQVPVDPDPYLARSLWPTVIELLDEGSVRRFFFIRYFENGLQLRLRFRIQEEATDARIAEALSASLRDWDASVPVRQHASPGPDPSASYLWPVRYVRDEHYFGENAETLYSELLNEQSSYLTMRLLSVSLERRQARYVGLLATLITLLQRVAPTKAELGRRIEESVQFADYWLRKHLPAGSLDDPDWQASLEADPAEAVRLLTSLRSAPSIVKLQQDQAVQHMASLLRRMTQELSEPDFYVTHSLHLLCNKLGFNLNDELFAFRTLKAWLEREPDTTLSPSPSVSTRDHHVQPAPLC